ncbi:MAG TPA: response regulator [Gemmataceae bacterium]|nr:response regulator [Gemmataceae bacterium]
MLNVLESLPLSPPCLILSHANAAYTALIARGFRRLGWGIYTARNGTETRRLARILKPDAVILQAELPEESGWLTCVKLTSEHPLLPVILVSDNLSPCNQELAAFVGARVLVCQAESTASLTEELDKTLWNRSILCPYSVPRSQRGPIKGSIPCSVQTLAGPSKSS